MTLRIIAVGKKHEDWIDGGVKRYQDRLKKPFELEWVFLPFSSLDGLRARQEESGRIISRLEPSDFVILLDETGKNVDSPSLSRIIGDQIDRSKRVTLIIGGAYGVDEAVKSRADFVWSLSNLVFPHQLVRLILCEQLYRAQEIYYNHPYHHE